MDSTCFCTAVGLGPESFRGSDVLLVPADGGYLAHVITPKGEALVAGTHGGSFRGGRWPRPNRRRVKSAKRWSKISRTFPRNFPAGWPRTLTTRCGRPSLCAVMAAEPAPRSAQPAIALTLLTSMTVPTRACAAETGIPARRQYSRSMPPDTIRGRARASASGSGFSTNFRSIPAALARFSAPAAAAVPGLVPAAWTFPKLLGELITLAQDRARGERSMNIYQPHLMRIREITDETVDTRTLEARVQGFSRRRAVSVFRRAVWRVFRLRRRRKHLLHRLPANPQRLHRVQLQGNREGDASAAPPRRGRHAWVSADPTEIISRSRR